MYKDNTKPQLELMCHQAGIPVTPGMPKHQMCSLIFQKHGASEPPVSPSQTLYSRRLSSLPQTASGIGFLTKAKLRTILKVHNLPYLGSKDELVWVFMFRNGRAKEAALREINPLNDLIQLTKELIMK